MIQVKFKTWLIVLNCFLCSAEDLEDLDEEEMLMRAIALSLEEDVCSIKGELLKKAAWKNPAEKNMNLQPFSDATEEEKEEMPKMADLDLDW